MRARPRHRRPSRRVLLAGVLAVAAAGAAAGAVLAHPAASRRPAPAAARPAVRRWVAGSGIAPIQAGARGRAARRAAVPILMYHVIGSPPRGAAEPQLWVPAARFAAQMRALARAGYHAITLERAYAAWTRGAMLPPRPIVISFDDGYLGDFAHARPALAQLGWPGVLNLELANVRRGDLTAPEVRALLRDGWEVESHTLTHPDLTTVGPARLRRELAGSRAALRRRFHVPARFFCYPSGRYDARVVAAVRQAGYLAATTTREGYASAGELLTLPRVRVDRGESPRELLARLREERPRR